MAGDWQQTLTTLITISSGWSGSPQTILRYLRQGAWEKSKACRQSEGFLVHCLSSVYTKKVSMNPQRRRYIGTLGQTDSECQPLPQYLARAIYRSASRQGDPPHQARWFPQSRIVWLLLSTRSDKC